MTQKTIAFISTFPPRRCGIAQFTEDLVGNVTQAAQDKLTPMVIAMNGADKFQYEPPVKLELNANVKKAYIQAAEHLNFSDVNLVCLQHEFGIFGGQTGNGEYILLLLKRLKVPIVTTFHTVLLQPSPGQYRVMHKIAEHSHQVVVMSHRGSKMLQEVYGIPKDKISIIPHGIPDLPVSDSATCKHQFGMANRKIILTFGLLGPNKGIEWVIKALPLLVQKIPNLIYLIVGATHPELIRQEGQKYRLFLQQIVNDLHLQDHVLLYNEFVEDVKLHKFLLAADYYITPYLSEQQITSGTLAYALGTGAAVISTPYWHAKELLADKYGKLIPFGNSDAIAHAILELEDHPEDYSAMCQRAFLKSRSMIWPTVGKTYWDLFTRLEVPKYIPLKFSKDVVEDELSLQKIPEPRIDHICRLTDDTGIIQHACFIIPDRKTGYCTDDNARALMVMAKYYQEFSDPEVLRFINLYFSFLCHAQRSDGAFHNFMTYDRHWIDSQQSDDALGRAIAALGTLAGCRIGEVYLPIIENCFSKALSQIHLQSIRGKAYAIMGLSQYVPYHVPEDTIYEIIKDSADALSDSFHENSDGNWKWFEPVLTYDNGMLCHALFLAGNLLGEEMYKLIGRESCEFLLSHIYNGENFSFIGQNGWYPRDGKKAQFDQQPIDAAGTIYMLKAAYETTHDEKYIKLLRRAFEWFLGKNDLGISLYDFNTKGCADGLGESGININQGAESILSFLLSLLCVMSCKSISPIEQNMSYQQGVVA